MLKDFWSAALFRHLKAHKFVQKGCFVVLYSLWRTIESKFHRFVIQHTPSENTGLWQLPKVSSAFKGRACLHPVIGRFKLSMQIWYFSARMCRRFQSVSLFRHMLKLFTNSIVSTSDTINVSQSCRICLWTQWQCEHMESWGHWHMPCPLSHVPEPIFKIKVYKIHKVEQNILNLV